MPTILVIEDEPDLARIVGSYLEKANFKVITAHRGDTGFALWQREKPDLVLLDLNLPGMDGLDITREIRKTSQIPIIMVTARVEEMDRLIGLELGADDYITKPFSPREVVARVRTVLRRSAPAPQTEQSRLIQIDDLWIDLDGHQVRRGGEAIDLTPTEFNLLVALASHPGRVLSRLQLLEQAQGVAFEGYERTIDAHIKNLRQKIERESKKPEYIQTVFGVGYKFAERI